MKCRLKSLEGDGSNANKIVLIVRLTREPELRSQNTLWRRGARIVNERIAYSVEEFARTIGAAPGTVRAAIKRGEYPVEHVGRRQFIPVWVVNKFITSDNGNKPGREP